MTIPFARAPSRLALALFCAIVGGAGAALIVSGSGAPVRSLRITLMASSIAFVLATFVLLLGTVLRAMSRQRIGPFGATIASAVFVLVYVGYDRVHFAVFRRHLDGSSILLTYEAIRAGTLRVSLGDVAFFLFPLLLVTLALVAVMTLLTRLRSRASVERGLRRGASPLVAAAIGLLLFRDELFDPKRHDVSLVVLALPWDRTELRAEGASSAANSLPRDFGLEASERTFLALEARRTEILAAPLVARERPSIMFVHVESLRSDMLTADLMPRTWRLKERCFTSTAHFSTGNNTGSGVFGLVTGLGAEFYQIARKHRTPSIPLAVLSRLGYSNHVWFTNDLETYEGIFDVVFAKSVERPFHPNEEDVAAADAHTVAALLDSIGKSGSAPRFDYVVLDSTHYDYAYPKAFERFTPAETLGVAFKNGTIVEDGINDRMRKKAAFVKNRYMNSVTYADELVGRIVAGLERLNRASSTLLVVTGDHGEAFWEHDVFGHGIALHDEQVRVPLVLCSPSPLSSRFTYTSHADVFPTVFDAIGLTGVPSPFMTGKSLLRYDPVLDAAVFGIGVTGTFAEYRFGIATLGAKVLFYNRDELPVSKVFDGHDEPILSPPSDLVSAAVTRALAAKVLR